MGAEGSKRLFRAVAAGGALAVLGLGSVVHAQRLGASQGLTVIVGADTQTAPMERLDVGRTNVTGSVLPTGSLRTVWTRQRRPLRHPPLVLDDGTVVFVSVTGDVELMSLDATDHGHVSLGAPPMSAPTLLADGTLVVVTEAGDAVGLRRGVVVFRTHLADPTNETDEARRVVVHRSGGPRVGGHHLRRTIQAAEPTTTGWTLPLVDGGVVVAFERTLVTLDVEGAIRTRSVSPVLVGSPLLATGRGVAFVAEPSGDVYAWDLASAEGSITLRGSFGGSVAGAVAVRDARHLEGIVDSVRLTTVDLLTGEARPLVRLTRSVLTGAFALDARTGVTFAEEMMPGGTEIVAFSPDGHETPLATPLTPRGILLAGDAGAQAFLPTAHTMLLADQAGTVAFATVDGHVGVLTATTKVTMDRLPCGTPPEPEPVGTGQAFRASAGFAGLVPAGPHAFLVACESGAVVLVRGNLEE